MHRTCQDGRGFGKTRKNVRRNSAHPDAKPNGWFGSPMQPIGARGGPKASPDTMKTPHCDRTCLAIVPGWSCRRCRRAAELPKLRPSQLCAEGRAARPSKHTCDAGDQVFRQLTSIQSVYAARDPCSRRTLAPRRPCSAPCPSSWLLFILALQQLAVWDLRSYATIQTVWGETESYQFSIDYRYRTGTTTKTGPMDSATSSDCSERLRTGQ